MLPPLLPHQADALARADGRSLALFHDPGLGKTRTSLEWYARLRAAHPDAKLLVLCPRSLIDAVWRVEVATQGLTATALTQFDPAADVWLCNYERIIRPATHALIRPELTRPLALVCDESSRLKDPRSLTTKTVLALSERCRWTLVCSGTPAPNGLWELWAQLRVVDPSRVHRSFYAWRREWFHLARRGHTLATPPPDGRAMAAMFRQGWDWAITEAKRTQLLAHLSPAIHWVRKENALSLPEKIFTTRHVTLSADEHRAYERMRTQLVVEFQQETITAELALTKLGKLRQLSSGFLYGEEGTHLVGASRLTVLLETLEELGSQPVIIWCQFKEEIEQISNALGERARTLYAGTEDRAKSLADFGATAQYLIAHPRSAAHGLTLTQCSTAIWYSLDWSLEAYTQANDRIHRIGQRSACLYVHLLAPGRIDDHIWNVLQQKTSLQVAISAALGSRTQDGHRPRHEAPPPAGVDLRHGGSLALRHS